MKTTARLVALTVALVCALAWTACASGDGPIVYLDMDDVRRLSALGEGLTLLDMDGFYHDAPDDAGIARIFPLEDGASLVVAADGEKEPVQYARLFKHGLGTEDERLCVDIRDGDIDQYLADDTAGPLVEAYLSSMQCPGACSYVVAIINVYPQTRDALLALDYRALPALSRILMANEHSIRADMAEVFLDEILSRRVFSSYASEEVDAFVAEADLALITYTGKPYKIHAPNPEWAK